MIHSSEVAVLDENSSWHGVKVEGLMEAAGRGVAENIIDLYPDCGSITLVCGTGNNGGDGFVAARYLSESGILTRVLLLKPPKNIRSDLSRGAFSSLPEDVGILVLGRGIEMNGLPPLFENSDVVVDCMLGAGAVGAPKEIYASVLSFFPEKKRVVAVDSPTGLGYKGCVDAAYTITFHDMKEAMILKGLPDPRCGEIITVDIGVPKEAATHLGPGDMNRFPRGDQDSRKGDGGRVLVIGGGPFIGAPSLAAMGALRGGADLVRVAIPKGLFDVVSSYSPDLIVDRLNTNDPFVLGPEVMGQLRPIIEWADVILVGPGAGTNGSTVELINEVLSHSIKQVKRCVIDADGLNSLSQGWKWKKKLSTLAGPFLVTPHRGELKKLLSSSDLSHGDEMFIKPYLKLGKRDGKVRKDLVKEASRLSLLSGVVTLLKGPVDLIVTPETHSLGEHVSFKVDGKQVSRRYNTTGSAAMTVGGTGDVLAGICAGLMGRGMTTFDAACLGAFILGRVGEEVFREKGYSMMASDLLDHIHIGN
ncbi:MAG: NAD(P)H-hydrate dehydratase [Thermoplasmata archaeon]|nr:NAD(P)H-hydrate dehydratase [Thermoplasmata archaeon]